MFGTKKTEQGKKTQAEAEEEGESEWERREAGHYSTTCHKPHTRLVLLLTTPISVSQRVTMND